MAGVKKRQKNDNSSLEGRKDNTIPESIIDKAIRGDRESLVNLCNLIARNVLFSTTNFMYDQLDAEDTAQEILIRVCEKIHTLKEPKAFKTWLNIIIQNEIRRYISKGSKYSTIINIDEYLETNDIEDDGHSLLPDEYAIKEEDRKEIIEMVNLLPEQQKRVVFLYYYENLNVNEVAEVMELSPSTVSHYLKIAKEKIKNELHYKSEKNKAFYSLSLLPMGQLLTNLYQQEANSLSPLTNKHLSLAIERGLSQIGSIPPAKSVLVVPGFFKAVVITLAASIVVTTGLVISGIFSDPHSHIVDPVEIIDTSGEITFTGTDEWSNYLNPKTAEVYVANERGVLVAHYWWITYKGSDDVLYSGEGESINDTLTMLNDGSLEGDYLLNYLMEDAAGVSYTLTRHFIIRSDNN